MSIAIVNEFLVLIPKDRDYFCFSLKLPEKAKILGVQERQGGLNISVFICPRKDTFLTEIRNFVLVGSDDGFKGHGIIKHIGIVQLPRKGLNFYLFEVR